MKLVVLLVFASIPAWAVCDTPHCSAVIPAGLGSFLPRSPAEELAGALNIRIGNSNLGNQDFRIELRLHGQNWAATNNNYLIEIGGFTLQHLGAADPALIFVNQPAGETWSCSRSPSVAWTADITVRISRSHTNATCAVEIFDVQTGNSIGSTSGTISAFGSSGTIQGDGILIGGRNATGDIAFLRWYNSTVPLGTAIPIAVSSCAPLGDWEFENNGIDCSGVGQTVLGISAYDNSPVYAPACNAGAQQTVRLGNSLSLNGANSYPIDGGASLTYAWSYFTGTDGVNQNPVITGAGTATPVTSSLTQFGSADFQLKVTDGSGNSSSCTLHDGVVVADSNGIVNLTSEGLDFVSQKLIGPVIMYGANPWPWADTQQKLMLDQQIGNVTNSYTPFWRTPQAGTITITGGSNVAIGRGTDLTLPCGGGSTPLSEAVLIIRYTGTDSRTHYMPVSIASCTDTTHIVLNGWAQGVYPLAANLPPAPYPNCDTGCSGLGWTYGYDGNSWGTWAYNGAPGNYYDGWVKGARAMYLRSGIDTYETMFEQQADIWWEFPVFDQGYGCDDGLSPYNQVVNSCLPGRSRALAGIVLRALQEGPSSPKWPGLRVVWALDRYLMGLLATNVPAGIVDGRENGYQMAELSYCALTDSASAGPSCQLSIKNALAQWNAAPFKRTDSTGTWWGNFQWANTTGGISATSYGGSGSVCVTNGSALVTYSGTGWTSALNTNFWTWPAPAGTIPPDNTTGDSIAYAVTVTGTNTATISPVYQGATQCNRGFAFGYPQNGLGFVGWGTQPYGLGMLGTSFGFAALAMQGYDAPSVTTYNTLMDDTVQWLINSGYNSTNGGLYNAVNYISCVPPISSANLPCFPNGVDIPASRSLAVDVMRDFSMDYQVTLSPAVGFAANLLMNQLFAKPGTCTASPCVSDGYYLSTFENGGPGGPGPPPVGIAPKWQGQFCGYEESCDMWPAVRLGAPPP